MSEYFCLNIRTAQNGEREHGLPRLGGLETDCPTPWSAIAVNIVSIMDCRGLLSLGLGALLEESRRHVDDQNQEENQASPRQELLRSGHRPDPVPPIVVFGQALPPTFQENALPPAEAFGSDVQLRRHPVGFLSSENPVYRGIFLISTETPAGPGRSLSILFGA